ncbi:MAG TPA: ribonuclease E activity regulator RraA [Candidatus Binatia bacterium]|jgi:regulator of ribonuclease activity A|nr:ribonuclease E activity regulator RraA [Candidatus Binatia bacterium]
MTFTTAGLADDFSNEVDAADPILRHFGGLTAFCGSIVTLDVYEDCGLLHEALESPGQGKVLVADGGGSLQRALLGQELAQLAHENGWQGIIVHGCVRHVRHLAHIPIGVLALAAAPLAAAQRGRGSSQKPVHFAGITFREGQFVYADADGILISVRDLLQAEK